jgi:hypothetical protein
MASPTPESGAARASSDGPRNQVRVGQARLSPARRMADAVHEWKHVVGPVLRDARADLPVLPGDGAGDELLVGLVRLFKCDAPARATDRRVCPCLDPAAAEQHGGRGLF